MQHSPALPSTAVQKSAPQMESSVQLVTVNVVNSKATHPGLKEALHVLAELSPRPKVTVQKNKKRKIETSAVITSSPYKLQLEEKQSTGRAPVRKQANVTKPQKISTNTVKTSTSIKKNSSTQVSVVIYNLCEMYGLL